MASVLIYYCWHCHGRWTIEFNSSHQMPHCRSGFLFHVWISWPNEIIPVNVDAIAMDFVNLGRNVGMYCHVPNVFGSFLHMWVIWISFHAFGIFIVSIQWAHMTCLLPPIVKTLRCMVQNTAHIPKVTENTFFFHIHSTFWFSHSFTQEISLYHIHLKHICVTWYPLIMYWNVYLLLTLNIFWLHIGMYVCCSK